MSDVEFFQTRMGQQFYDGTMRRIADALEVIGEALTKNAAPKTTAAPPSLKDGIEVTVSDEERQDARQQLVYEQALRLVREIARARPRGKLQQSWVIKARAIMGRAGEAW